MGYRPGNILVGNSVYSMGFIGSLGTGLKTSIGGEVRQFTNMVQEGRRLAFERLNNELVQNQGHGMTGVSNEVIFHGTNIEFLSVGSAIHRFDDAPVTRSFTTAADGQELFCLSDAGFEPISFVFGNVAYALGIGRSFLGNLRQMARGEVHQYSDIFTKTRNLALERITSEAQAKGANAVIGIRTTIVPFGETQVQEMIMVGTAATHSFNNQSAAQLGMISSDLTAEETWNVVRMGYMPLQLVLGTSVYSLGVVGGIKAAMQGFVKGEISATTQLIYGAREQSLKKVQQQASLLNADDVIGVKTYIYQLSDDLIELLAIGTAVKRIDGVMTRSEQIPPQAIIQDKDTFVNTAELAFGKDINRPAR
jgi:uncharacterized protein YbjQ (UPF0145 family)